MKKHNADEMEALRQENSRLRRKIEVDPTQKGKAKETSDVAGSPAFQPTEEESEYNPTPHTFTTTQQTLILSTHHTHFHSTLPGNIAPPPCPPHTSRPTTCPPHYTPLISPLQPSQPPYCPYPSSQLHLHFSHPRSPSHPSSPATTSPTQAPSPFHRFHRQHPLPHQVGTFHTGTLRW